MTLLLLAAAALHVCAAQEKRPVIDWLKNNKDTTTAAQLLQQLYPKPISDKAKLTLLIPTNDVRNRRGVCARPGWALPAGLAICDSPISHAWLSVTPPSAMPPSLPAWLAICHSPPLSPLLLPPPLSCAGH